MSTCFTTKASSHVLYASRLQVFVYTYITEMAPIPYMEIDGEERNVKG